VRIYIEVVIALVAALPCAAHTGLLDTRVTVADSEGLNPPADFTLEAWIRPTLFHFDGDVYTSYQQIVVKWLGEGNQRSYLLDLYQDQVEFAATSDGTSENSVGIYSAVHLALDQWVHVAGVYSAGTMFLFINGQQDPQTIYLPDGPFAAQAPVYIGGSAYTMQGFHGSVDEVRISYVARYSADFVVRTIEFFPDSDTMLLMHLNEGAGTFTDNIGLLGGDGTLDDSSGWGEGAPITHPGVGDLNCDGAVNNFDISPFVLALTHGAAYH
jgi:hypothetical protein